MKREMLSPCYTTCVEDMSTDYAD
ncbi:DUF4113 domain-containing protein [Cronobacter dublinensis]